VYAERPSRVPGGQIWQSTVAAGEARILPDGCMDMIWDGHELFVAGPDAVAYSYDGTPGTRLTGLRFAPGQAPRVLGVPAHELVNQRVPIQSLWPPVEVRDLVDRLGTSRRPDGVLEEVAGERLAAPDDDERLVEAILTGARSGIRISETATRVGLSPRQLHRRCLASFGYGAKTLAMILRMHLALGLVEQGLPLADAAVRAGYADQPHLAREVKRLAGAPIGGVVSRRRSAGVECGEQID